jgi:hypothetical protein
VFTECFPADARGMGRHPPTTFSQLDYLLVHPLSGQGLPLAPKDWEALLRDAGWRLREVRRILWTGLYVAEPE